MQLTIELAYLIGSLRDGSVSKFKDKTGKLHHSITFYSKSIDWLKILQQKIQKIFNKLPEIQKYSGKTPYIRIYSKGIAEILSKEFKHPLGVQIEWRTPDIIKQSNAEIQKHFIAGLWDAEGGVDLQNKQTKFYLSWKGNQCPPLEDVKQILNKFEIRTGKVCKYKNSNGKFPRFVLRISTESTRKFFEEIPINHPEKKRKLQFILSGVWPQNSLPAEGLGPENGRD